MRAFFIGGHLDGQWRDVSPARRVVVPVVKAQSATGMPPMRTYHEIVCGENMERTPVEKQTYVRQFYDENGHRLAEPRYVLESIEDPAPHAPP